MRLPGICLGKSSDKRLMFIKSAAWQTAERRVVTCLRTIFCADAGETPAIAAYLSLHISLVPGRDGSGAPGPGTLTFTAAPALHASNLSPWPLLVRVPGALPCPVQDPRARPAPHAAHTLQPGATLALPVLWAAPGEAAGRGAASEPSTDGRSSADSPYSDSGPAVEVGLVNVSGESAAEGAKALEEGPPGAGAAVGGTAKTEPGYWDAGNTDARGGAAEEGPGCRASGGAVIVPLLGSRAAVGQRRRLHLAAHASPKAVHRGPGAALPFAWGAAAHNVMEPGSHVRAGSATPHGREAGGRGGIGAPVALTYLLLAPPGRAHLVLFRDAQPPLVLRNDSPLTVEVGQQRLVFPHVQLACTACLL